MTTLLLKHADVLVTMDAERREISDGAVFIRDGFIEAVGPSSTLPTQADEEIDLSGCVALPGLVNTHHHMFQTLTRALPAAQDAELFRWLQNLYPIWTGITPAMLHTASKVAMAELMLSGCTTSSDHLYLFPNGCTLEDSLEAASDLGMRFTATRGGMSVGESQGGLPPDNLVEEESAILLDMQRVVERWHDNRPGAMLQIALAPCSPFSVSPDLMRETAALARSLGVRLHTHLAENDNDVNYSIEHFGMTPAQYAESLGWVGEDVWHAHCVKLDAEGIDLFARTGTGIAHCPCSNMRLASGIAPIPAMRHAGVPIGLGVDGSASNDSSHMLHESRQAMLLARVGYGPAAMTAREALELATLGGARVLGRTDIGALAPGMAADIVAFPVDQLASAGNHDPVASLVFCPPDRVRHSIINGASVIHNGTLSTCDLDKLVHDQFRLSRQLVTTRM